MPIATKNQCGKTRKVNDPYEIWVMGEIGGMDTWYWFILKKYQAPEKEKQNPYARWFTAVSSPITREQNSSGYEMGDTYVNDIVRHAVILTDEEKALAIKVLNLKPY